MLKRLTLSPLGEANIRQCSNNPVIRASYAPTDQAGTLFRSTIASVDTAGWTEVVIPGAPQVLSDPGVTCSQPIAFTSNDDVCGAASDGGIQLHQSGADLKDSSAGRRLSFSEQSRISCPNKYEVTL